MKYDWESVFVVLQTDCIVHFARCDTAEDHSSPRIAAQFRARLDCEPSRISIRQDAAESKRRADEAEDSGKDYEDLGPFHSRNSARIAAVGGNALWKADTSCFAYSRAASDRKTSCRERV